jgi:hypothetical protein
VPYISSMAKGRSVLTPTVSITIETITVTTHELTRCPFLAAKRTRRKVLMRGQGATWTSPPPFGFCNIHFKVGSDLILKVRGFWPAGLLSIVNGWLFIST